MHYSIEVDGDIMLPVYPVEQAAPKTFGLFNWVHPVKYCEALDLWSI